MTLWDWLSGTIYNPKLKYGENQYEADQRKLLKESAKAQ
jgi:hypothetical protein